MELHSARLRQDEATFSQAEIWDYIQPGRERVKPHSARTRNDEVTFSQDEEC